MFLGFSVFSPSGDKSHLSLLEAKTACVAEHPRLFSKVLSLPEDISEACEPPECPGFTGKDPSKSPEPALGLLGMLLIFHFPVKLKSK